MHVTCKDNQKTSNYMLSNQILHTCKGVGRVPLLDSMSSYYSTSREHIKGHNRRPQSLNYDVECYNIIRASEENMLLLILAYSRPSLVKNLKQDTHKI